MGLCKGGVLMFPILHLGGVIGGDIWLAQLLALVFEHRTWGGHI